MNLKRLRGDAEGCNTLFDPLSPAPRSSLKHSSLVLGILYKFKLVVHEYVVFVFLFSGTQ